MTEPCPICGRDVVVKTVVVDGDGPDEVRETVTLDAEVITVVGHPGGDMLIRGRRLHRETCT